jgi:hypothetical protein
MNFGLLLPIDKLKNTIYYFYKNMPDQPAKFKIDFYFLLFKNVLNCYRVRLFGVLFPKREGGEKNEKI